MSAETAGGTTMTNVPEWISHDVGRLRSTIDLALRAAANETTLTSDTSRLTTVESILRADQPHGSEVVAHARELTGRIADRIEGEAP
jgi:hypothetical protein